jgi:CRISPR-associated protein Cmr5
MSEEKSVKTTVNKRAKFAYDRVEKVKQSKNDDMAKKYKSYSKKLLAMIKINGLASTLVFMLSKSKSNKQPTSQELAYKELYNHIQQWLEDEDCPVNTLYSNISSKNNDLIEKVLSFDSNSYRAVTKEVMEFSNWLRRFAEGMIKDEE